MDHLPNVKIVRLLTFCIFLIIRLNIFIYLIILLYSHFFVQPMLFSFQVHIFGLYEYFRCKMYFDVFRRHIYSIFSSTNQTLFPFTCHNIIIRFIEIFKFYHSKIHHYLIHYVWSFGSGLFRLLTFEIGFCYITMLAWSSRSDYHQTHDPTM